MTFAISDILTEEERGGLTIWGEAISAQIRGEERDHLALHVRDDAPRSNENGSPVLVPAGDLAKLRALLDEADLRAGR